MEFGSRSISLDTPKVMGVLNVTPDSFSDGGVLFKSNKLDLPACLSHAESMLQEGASFIDVGGESTRPGAAVVSEQEELDRVLPVVEAIKARLDVVVSVDTSNPAVMSEAATLGAGLINDVRALEREGAIEAAVATGLPVCLMHMQGSPESMQLNPEYRSVELEVKGYLQSRISKCVSAGIGKDKLLVDPGIGFGKTDEHNLNLLRSLSNFSRLECPILVGVSRKSMIGRLLGRDVPERLAGSLAFALESARRGANIIRVHDVAETVDVLKVHSLMNEGKS